MAIGLLPSSLASGQASDSSQASDVPQSPSTTYFQLNRQIYARHQDSGSGGLSGLADKFQAVTDQLDKLISHEVKVALNSPGASAATITSAISKLQGQLSLQIYDPDPRITNTPFASLFKLNGDKWAGVGYIILRGGDGIPDTQPYLKFYNEAAGSWLERADGGAFCLGAN